MKTKHEIDGIVNSFMVWRSYHKLSTQLRRTPCAVEISDDIFEVAGHRICNVTVSKHIRSLRTCEPHETGRTYRWAERDVVQMIGEDK